MSIQPGSLFSPFNLKLSLFSLYSQATQIDAWTLKCRVERASCVTVTSTWGYIESNLMVEVINITWSWETDQDRAFVCPYSFFFSQISHKLFCCFRTVAPNKLHYFVVCGISSATCFPAVVQLPSLPTTWVCKIIRWQATVCFQRQHNYKWFTMTTCQG